MNLLYLNQQKINHPYYVSQIHSNWMWISLFFCCLTPYHPLSLSCRPAFAASSPTSHSLTPQPSCLGLTPQPSTALPKPPVTRLHLSSLCLQDPCCPREFSGALGWLSSGAQWKTTPLWLFRQTYFLCRGRVWLSWERQPVLEHLLKFRLP